MGIDVLETFLLIERHYGVRLGTKHLEPRVKVRTPYDMTAGELLDVIRANGGTRLPICAACTYSLIGHGESGICPECGLPFDEWEVLRTILADVAGVDRKTIGRDTFLFKDLKLT